MTEQVIDHKAKIYWNTWGLPERHLEKTTNIECLKK